MPLTRNRPKCLLPVGGRTILARQLDTLAAAGIDDVIVVTGHGAGALRAACNGRARRVHNPRYGSTNSLYSLALAESAVDGRALLLLNSDVVVDPALVTRLLEAPAEDALLVDLEAALDDEAMKVAVRDGRVAAIDKALDPRMADGENVGVVKFGRRGSAALFRAARALLAAGRQAAWAPAAYAAILGEVPIAAVPTAGLPWIEIDFPVDLERAEREIVPRLAPAAGQVAAAAAVPAAPAGARARRA